MAKDPKTRIARALLEDGDWPNYVHLDPALTDHMHALGILITRYNALEVSLFRIISHYLNDYETEAPAIIFARLNNHYRLDVVASHIKREKDPAVKSRLVAFVAAYNTCTDNRNFLAHAQIQTTAKFLPREISLSEIHKTLLANKITLSKASKSRPQGKNYTELEVSELRHMADDIKQTEDFGFELYVFMLARRFGGTLTLADGKKLTPALPETPPVPHKLSLFDPATE
jgi:hypothetical protein